MADYQGKNVVIIGLGLTGLSCVDFFLARGVTPRVMDTRMTPPGLDKLPEAVERHTGSLNDEWLMAADRSRFLIRMSWKANLARRWNRCAIIAWCLLMLPSMAASTSTRCRFAGAEWMKCG